MREFQSAMQVIGAPKATALIQFPSGRWGFVGSVPIPLAFYKKDGSDITAEEVAKVKSFGLGLFTKTIGTVAFETKEEAIAKANELGVEFD